MDAGAKSRDAWIWEAVLKRTTGSGVLEELKKDLPFPEGVPRLKQMSIVRDVHDLLTAPELTVLRVQQAKRLLRTLKTLLRPVNVNEEAATGGLRGGPLHQGQDVDEPLHDLKKELKLWLKLVKEGKHQDHVVVKKEADFSSSAWVAFGSLTLENAVRAAQVGGHGPVTMLPSRRDTPSTANLETRLTEAEKVTARRFAELQQMITEMADKFEWKLAALQSVQVVNEDAFNPKDGVQVGRRGGECYSLSSTPSPHPRGPSLEEEDRKGKRPREDEVQGSDEGVQAVNPSLGSGSTRGRPRKKWTEEEVDALKAGVEKYGAGKWKEILEEFKGVLGERSNVDIKDKYLGLTGTRKKT